MRKPPERNVALHKKCQHCGEGFIPPSNRSRWCSPVCMLQYRSVLTASGCRLWTGPKMKNGYGTGAYAHGSQRYLPHRLSYETFVGSIPNGLFVCHRCDVRLCINPDHLFLGTQEDNMQDCAKKGRNSRKLTNEEVLQIRSVVGVPRMHLAKYYGVTDNMIRTIQQGKWWKHLLPEKNA